MRTDKLSAIKAKYAQLIEETKTELATNFDVPAQSIINHACAQMGITVKDWREVSQ